ncbi:MAG TPA: 3-phosphoshikimate 1-carboxyvinyltransferase [Clostridia bacterium]|nr:3-phosphoshikimate 1-carboxyvinyltransferase [Clostridia bacterium]
MQVKLQKAFLQGEIDIIISKSYAHRLLIMASLADTPTKIMGRSEAKDVIQTVNCLNSLGANIIDTPDGYIVNPIVEKIGGVCNAGESGSTLRFLLPVVAALGTNCLFTAEGRLGQRPMKDLIECLKIGGVSVSDNAPYKVSGKLHSGDYVIRGDISSQYITGLLLALPTLDGDSKIIIENNIASSGYLDITLECIEQFGVDIKKMPYGFFVKGGQKYTSPKVVIVEGDWSNAAFFLASGALNGNIKVNGLNINSKQGDKEIFNIMKDMGADIRYENNSVQVQRSNLTHVEIDADSIPDLVPIISVLAACAKGNSKIKNIERLRLKESDRITSTMHMLDILGIQNKYLGSLNISGGDIAGGKVDAYNDHRIVMAASVAALKAEGIVEIAQAEAVNKSYPNFFEEYKRLGGKIDVTY